MKKLIQISICLMILILNMHTVKAMNYQAQIQDHYYESFQEAIKDILDEKQKGPIYLLDDVILDIGTINKDIEIIGNHHQISVPCQSQTNDSESQGRLNIQAHLTFNQCDVQFNNMYSSGNNTWSVVMSSTGVLDLINQSHVSFVNYGIYASNGAIINVDHSVVSLKQMKYTSMMGESYGILNLNNNAKYNIEDAIEPNGITGFHINVDHSSLVIQNCTNQAIVKGNLNITNQGSVSLLNNEVGYNMYSGNQLYVDETSSLKMNENKNCALLSQGKQKRTMIVKKGGKLEAQYNGSQYQASDDESKYYAQTSALNFGVYGWYERAQKIYFYPNSDDVIFEDGAKVNISHNYVRGISNYGNLYLGNQTIITSNGGYQKGNPLDTCRVGKGGGIYNAGKLTLSSTVLYNNHARLAGDDLYGEETGSVYLSTVGNNWILDDCNHKIDGWYQDTLQHRWDGEHLDRLYLVNIEKNQTYHALEAKAAHGIIKEDIKTEITPTESVKVQAVKTGDTTPLDYWYTLIGLSLTVMLLFFIKYVMKKRD